MTIQQASGLTHAAMLGLGVYRPERVVTNDKICEVLDSSDKWIQSRSGIKTRRFAGLGEAGASPAKAISRPGTSRPAFSTRWEATAANTANGTAETSAMSASRCAAPGSAYGAGWVSRRRAT